MYACKYVYVCMYVQLLDQTMLPQEPQATEHEKSPFKWLVKVVQVTSIPVEIINVGLHDIFSIK